MRILILTQPLINNYGGILQNYSLQTILKRRGHSVETLKIEMSLSLPLYKRYCRMIPVIVKFILLSVFEKIFGRSIRRWITQKEQQICYSKISKFIDNNISTTPLVDRLSDLKHYLHYDAYVVGSDQVWRNEYSPHLPIYFLDFLPADCQAKKIAYAASFGKAQIDFPQSHIGLYASLLQRFDAVSVREYSGIDLCRTYFHVSADIVPDPTMMLSGDDYRTLLGAYKNCAKGKLVTYILDDNDAQTAMIKRFAEKCNLEVIRLRGEYFRSDLQSAYPEKHSIEYWLAAIESAEYIITDSFHGTIFSLLFEKKFFTFINHSRGKERFYTLDKMFDISCRFINTESTDMRETENLDYSVINKKLADYREIGDNFLRKAGF